MNKNIKERLRLSNDSEIPKNVFPSPLVSELAKMENAKRQYYRPIYSLHKWWGRRPGVTFRAIGLFSLMSDLAPILTKNNKNEIDPSSPFFKAQSFKEKTILDPFMGGGTTIIELARMKAKVIGCDLNPVSWWIVKQELSNIPIDELKKNFNDLSEKVGEKIKGYYKTHCSTCNQLTDALYFFWASNIECPSCKKDLFLFNTLFLNKGHIRGGKLSNDDPPTVICPRCLALNDAPVREEVQEVLEVKCQRCSIKFDPNKGIINRGKYVCIHCSYSDRITSTLQSTIKEKKTVKEKRPLIKLKRTMYAIEYSCSDCKIKTYKEPEKYDLEVYEKIKTEVEKNFEKLTIPRQEIPPGRDTTRLLSHNFSYFYDLFNERQLLSLSLLLEEISVLEDSQAKELLLTTFSNCLEYNNLLVPYNYPYRKIHHLFTHHAYPVTTRPVENNVWGSKDGAGSFFQVFKRTVKALKFTKEPYEKVINNNKIKTIKLPEEQLSVSLSNNFDDLVKDKANGMLLCKDSRELSEIPTNSIDAVITDPPYYNNINYSELSNFFYVWLRLLLKEKYDHFKPDYVPQEKEVVEDIKAGKTAEKYEEGLRSIFRECYRVLKSEGSLFFTYHHSSGKSWKAIFNAIQKSTFQIKAVYPVISETEFNPHIRNKKTISFDAIIHCKKINNKEATKLNSEQFEKLAKEIELKLDYKINQISNKLSLENKRVFVFSYGLEIISSYLDKYLFTSKYIDYLFDQVEKCSIIS